MTGGFSSDVDLAEASEAFSLDAFFAPTFAALSLALEVALFPVDFVVSFTLGTATFSVGLAALTLALLTALFSVDAGALRSTSETGLLAIAFFGAVFGKIARKRVLGGEVLPTLTCRPLLLAMSLFLLAVDVDGAAAPVVVIRIEGTTESSSSDSILDLATVMDADAQSSSRIFLLFTILARSSLMDGESRLFVTSGTRFRPIRTALL